MWSLGNKYVSNIYMLFENSVTYGKCDHYISMLFEKLNNVPQKFIDMNMSYKKITHRVRKSYIN